MEPQNSATRLHLILTRASSILDKDANALTHWCRVFSIESAPEENRYIDAAERVLWMNVEVDRLKEHLRDVKKYPERGYVDVISGIKQGLSPSHFGRSSDHVRSALTPTRLTALDHIGLNLQDEEDVLSQDQISVLQDFIKDLEAKSAAVPIGPYLHMVLRRHIRLLQRAIDAYPIWGVRAFIDALHDASGDLVASREIAEKGEVERSVVESLKATWGTVNDYVAEVDKVTTSPRF